MAFLGTLLFVFCAACLVFDVQTIPILGDTRNLLGIYALVITAFMAGSHWGQHFDFESKWGDYLPITSNEIAVLVWIGFLTLPFKGSLIVFGISFFVLLWIDQKLRQNDLISLEYFQTRCLVTLIFVSTLYNFGYLCLTRIAIVGARFSGLRVANSPKRLRRNHHLRKSA